MGELIVNADDLGLDIRTTDAVLSCFRARRISSASAMVWMADSRRAALLARENGLPVRLHLNLTQPFTDPTVPDDVRRRQAKLVRYFKQSRLTYWIYNPRRRRQIGRCIEDQLGAFTHLYGEAPSGIDGHNHVHTCPNVLLSGSLAGMGAMRATFTFLPREKGVVNRGVRRLVNWMLRRRFESTQLFISIRDLDSRLDAGELAARLALARDASVEVMTHPGEQDEYEFLMGEDWQHAIAGFPLGRFAGRRSSAATEIGA